jgi:hypothetical protein
MGTGASRAFSNRMLLASETSPAFGPLDSRRMSANRDDSGTSRNAACGYAARRISSNLTAAPFVILVVKGYLDFVSCSEFLVDAPDR